MMKSPCALSILFGAAILVLGATAGQASAGGIDGWGSYGGYAGGGYAYTGRGGCGYGACGYGGCGLSASGGGTYYYGRLDYDRYIVGHGPMYPAGDCSIGYSYGAPAPTAPNTSAEPNRR